MLSQAFLGLRLACSQFDMLVPVDRAPDRVNPAEFPRFPIAERRVMIASFDLRFVKTDRRSTGYCRRRGMVGLRYSLCQTIRHRQTFSKHLSPPAPRRPPLRPNRSAAFAYSRHGARRASPSARAIGSVPGFGASPGRIINFASFGYWDS